MSHQLTIKILIFFFTLSFFAQRPSPDKLKTNSGELTIQPILHGTLVLQFNDKTIYIDPYGGGKAFENMESPDLILITDIHGDHLNSKTLDAIKTNGVPFIVPQAVADKLPEMYSSNVEVLNNGGISEYLSISIEAIPMYNLPESDDAKHTKGRGNGYILTIDGIKLYISGDTEDIPEMRSLKNIDVAFVCMNLPYTMDIHQAASAVLEFKPKVVYPYHYRGKPDMSDTEAFKKLINSKNSNIDVRLRNWYPDYEL